MYLINAKNAIFNSHSNRNSARTAIRTRQLRIYIYSKGKGGSPLAYFLLPKNLPDTAFYPSHLSLVTSWR